VEAQIESLESCSWYKDKSLRRSSICRCFSGRSVDTFEGEKEFFSINHSQNLHKNVLKFTTCPGHVYPKIKRDIGM